MRRLLLTTGVFILIMSVLSTSHAQSMRLGKYQDSPQKHLEMHIASLSIYPEKWDKPANWTKIETMVRQALSQNKPQLVVTPEGVLDGYVINNVNREKDSDKKSELIKQFIELSEPIDGPYIKKACSLADELDIFFTLGFLERREDRLYNSVILIDPDGDIIGRYSKTHFAQGYQEIPTFYQPGNEYPVFDTPFGKIGIMICYDRQLPENARILALKGAQILLVPSYGSFDEGDGWNTAMMRTRAYENRCALVFCHPQQSLLITRHGKIEVMGGKDETVYYTVNTDPEKIKDRFENRRPSMYGSIIDDKLD